MEEINPQENQRFSQRHVNSKELTGVPTESEHSESPIYFPTRPETPGEKIAVVRCDIVSEVCPGVACLKAYNRRKVHFERYGQNVEIIGFFTCGGCPGRRVHRLVESLIKHGLTTIHLSSCMLTEKSYPKCPHLQEIKETIENKGVKIIEGTHH